MNDPIDVRDFSDQVPWPRSGHNGPGRNDMRLRRLRVIHTKIAWI